MTHTLLKKLAHGLPVHPTHAAQVTPPSGFRSATPPPASSRCS